MISIVLAAAAIAQSPPPVDSAVKLVAEHVATLNRDGIESAMQLAQPSSTALIWSSTVAIVSLRDFYESFRVELSGAAEDACKSFDKDVRCNVQMVRVRDQRRTDTQPVTFRIVENKIASLTVGKKETGE